jgi:hypothetical protein
MMTNALEARLLGIRLMQAQAANGPEKDSATDVILRREMELRRRKKKQDDDDDGGRELVPEIGGAPACPDAQEQREPPRVEVQPPPAQQRVPPVQRKKASRRDRGGFDI